MPQLLWRAAPAPRPCLCRLAEVPSLPAAQSPVEPMPLTARTSKRLRRKALEIGDDFGAQIFGHLGVILHAKIEKHGNGLIDMRKCC